MSDGGEKLPLSERVFYGFNAVSQWAIRNNRTLRGDGTGNGKGRGCSTPLSCLAMLIFLIVVLLCPVFILPMMLVRFARLGFSGLRYGASVEVTSGEEARWGHGALQPVPGPARINAGAVAIAAADPGFRARALTDWAFAASMLICQSLVSGDATCTRTFMSNGMYRAHQALLELRTDADVSFAGSWRAVDAYVVGAVRTPLVEEVRVRVTCHGWRLERHQPTGVTLRGGPDEGDWSEDLTFARSAGTVTPPGGGLPASRCPSCGAHLDLDLGGACRFCKGIVTAGRHDWVLVSWQREPW
jgi:hypothetical protein